MALKQEMRESEAALIEEHRKALESQRLDQISREEVARNALRESEARSRQDLESFRKKWPSMKQ